MTDKKIPLTGGNQKTANQNLQADYSKIPNEKEIVDGYYSVNSFFREASERKNREAVWYFNQSREMLRKPHLALNWRDHFSKQASEYLQLMVIARGGSNV